MKKYIFLSIALALNSCVDQASSDIEFTLFNQTNKDVEVQAFIRDHENPANSVKAVPILISENSSFSVIRETGINSTIHRVFYSVRNGGIDSIRVYFNAKYVKVFKRNPPNECYLCDGDENHHAYITETDFDEAQPLVFAENLIESAWRCTVGAGLQEELQYNELRFISDSSVEGWGHFVGESEPELFFTTTYQIIGEEIVISQEDESFTARLNSEHTGLITNIDEEGECVFYKQ